MKKTENLTQRNGATSYRARKKIAKAWGFLPIVVMLFFPNLLSAQTWQNTGNVATGSTCTGSNTSASCNIIGINGGSSLDQSNTPFRIFTSSQERMRFQPNGNIGIGTSSPTQLLHLNKGILFLTGANAFGGPMMVLGGGDSPSTINGQWGIEYQTGNEGLNFWRPFSPGSDNPGNHFLFIKNNGNVGIGTGNPQNKLEVCGTIRAKEVLVQVGWCDYVFADDYELMPLNDLKSYLSENHHLPGIDAASEIESNGLPVAEMMAKQMEKIEELTLYILQQQDQIDELKNVLNSK